nr:autotransporter-associated beta strand repeat-containing protein [Sessilibacter corallicola]
MGSAGEAAGTDLFIAAGANVNLNPGAGNVQTFNGTIADDSVASFSSATNGEGSGGGVTISSGLVEFNGENTFTGETNLAGGVLRADDGVGINAGSRINIAGGILETSGIFDRTVGFNVGSVGFSGSGGFAALGDDLTVTLSAGIPLTVGQGAFLPLGGSLDFGSHSSDSQVEFTNDIILNGADLGLNVSRNQNEGSTALISGVISDGNAPGGITVNGNGDLGTLFLDAENTYTGLTDIVGGTLVLTENGSLSGGSAVNIDTNGVFDISAATDQTLAGLQGGGELEIGTTQLTINQDNNTVFEGGINGDGGSIIKSGSGVLTLAGANAFTAGTVINAGTLALATAGSLENTGTVTVNTGAIFDTSESDQIIDGLTGSGRVNIGASALTINQEIDTTFSGAIADGGIFAGTGGQLIKNGEGELTLSGANSFTGAAQINSGVLTLIDSGAFATATVNIADDATLNNNSSGLAAIATLTNNGTVNLNADDTISMLVNTGTINNDQFTLEATNGFALNDGSVINANLGSGAVTTNGTVALNGTSATETFLVESGVTTLGAGERLNDSVNLTVNNSAQLTLGGDEQIGSLFGAGELATADSVLSVDDGNFDGVISGNGDVIKTSGGNLILTNNNTFTGTAQITSGTLTLTDEGALASDSITVAGGATLVNNSSGLDANATLNNDGIVNLNSDDTISTLVNTGIINNDQFTLEANDGFNLNNGSVVNANLGTGAVTANGIVALNGTSATETFIVESGVTTLGAEERLNDAVDVTIADNARIILGGNERISGLLGAGELATSASRLIVDDGNFDGDISGAGDIVKISDGTLTLTNRNTFAGPAQINAGTLTLSNDASLATDTVNVAVGATLTNNSSGLADNTTLTNDGTVNLNSNDSIANLVNTGTINNDQFTLEATNGFALNNGSVINANLGNGSVTTNGNVSVNGTSATETFMVQSGVTTLGASERLNDSVNLTIAESAQLVLGGDEQIGNLNGAGELATANSQLLVDSGNFDGIISGTGGVIKTSDDTLVLSNSNTFTGQALVESGVLQIVENGALATNSVTVTDSAILINESAGFADSADVTVNGLVQLTQSDWINGLLGRGDVELINDSVLSVVAGDFSGSLSGSGALTKEGNGELTLRGENTFSGAAQINSGSLILEDNASLSTETVNVSQEATLTNNSSGLSDNTRLTNSGTVVVNSDDTVAVLNNSGLLQGEGTLTAATYNLNDGTVVESNLGAGVVNTNGDVTLSGNSDAELINIGAGSVLTLAESEILNDLATVNVASMGLLSLIGGDETIQRLLGDGSLATNGNNLIVTNGGEFNGSIVGSDESNLMVTGDTLVLGGDDDTEFANVSVASGSDIELTDNISITANDNIQVDEGGSLIIGEAANLASNLITVDGTLILADGESLDYALLNGAGSIETDAFVNNTDSTVGGNLTFTGDFTNTGVLSPGNSPGLVTIGGNFTENGNLELEVISPETGGVTADQVRVGGTITLGATSTLTLVNDADSPQTAGTVYNLLTNLSGGTRSVDGNFAQVLFDSDGLNNGQQATSNAAAVFDLDTGQAIFTGLNNADSTFRELGNSVNTGAVANALIAVSELDNGDNQIRSSQLSGNFLRTALESGNIGENLSLFAPEFFGSLADVGFQTNSQSLDLARSRLLNPQDAGSFSGIVAVNTADFDGADSGTDGQLNSSTLGIDYVFENTLHLGGTITSFDGDLDANTGDVDVESGLTLQGFAGYSLTEKWDIFGSLVYSSQSYDIDRQTQQGIVAADTDGDLFGINLGASYDLVQVRNAKISPYAIVSSSFYSQDAFAEQGAIDALSIESYDADLYRIKTGISVLSSYEFSNSRRLFLRADIGVSQQLSDDRDDLRASIIADNRIAFPVEVDESADAQIDVDLGAVYYFLPKHSLSFDYQGKFSDTGSNVFNLRYQIEF